MQLRVDELVRQSEADGFQLNESKCKELRISFSRSGKYTCPVFHHSLLQYLSNEMERLQKRALRIIQPDLSYAEALGALDITSLYEGGRP
ncbi:unnamed protein product [Porites evermanni]|uniref:Reverse transcriptase n=1 Tax=Porites evermanni TaxID=104178 RepID=A0ABN8M1U0_9CNID|nr:unnamed protein product [Porites evermanni]